MIRAYGLRRLRVWRAILLVPFLLAGPASAQSGSCDLLRARMSGANGDLLGIAQDYPKTHIAIVACMASQDTDEQRGSCAIAAIVTACFGMGSDYCADLTSRWERVGRQYQAIGAQMQALGCRQ